MHKKKYLLTILFIVITFAFTIVNVNAKGIGTFGENVKQKGTYNSTRFSAGKTVTNEADVDGLSFVAGEEVTLKGKAPYGFYAGRKLTVNENVQNDAFVAGESIIFPNGSVIGRDAFVAGKKIKINSTIGRDLRLGASIVDLSGATINGDAYISADKIVLNNDTKILGTLSYAKGTKVIGLTKNNVKKVNITKAVSNNKKESKSDKIIKGIINFIYSVARAFILMVILLWLIPKLGEKLTKEELKPSTIAKKSAIGLGVLLLVPIIAIIALISSLLLPVALITIALYAVSLYLGSIFVYYIIGNYLDEKLIKKNNKYLTLICGIAIVKLVCLIPVLGALISIIVFLYGLGIILVYINSIRKESI